MRVVAKNAAVAGVAAVTISMISWPSLSTAYAAPSPTTVLIASGQITRAGAVNTKAVVTAFAEPTLIALRAAGRSGIPRWAVGQVAVGADGKFAIRADTSVVPGAYLGPNGQIDIDLVADDGVGNVEWHYSTVPASANVTAVMSTGGARAALPVIGKWADGRLAPVTHIDLATGETRNTGEVKARAATWPAAPSVASARAVKQGWPAVNVGASAWTSRGAKALVAQSRLVRPAIGGRHKVVPLAGGACGATYLTGAQKYRLKATYATVYSFSGAPVTMAQGTGGSTTMTLGLVAQAKSGALSASGTFASTWSSGVTQSGIVDARVSNRVNYVQTAVTCGTATGWRPGSVADYFIDFARVPHVNYPYCTNKAAGAEFRTGTATNTAVSGGLEFPGLSVSAQSGYGTSQELTYKFAKAGKICGDKPEGALRSSLVSATS